MDMIPSVRIHIYICIYEMYMKRSEKINTKLFCFQENEQVWSGVGYVMWDFYFLLCMLFECWIFFTVSIHARITCIIPKTILKSNRKYMEVTQENSWYVALTTEMTGKSPQIIQKQIWVTQDITQKWFWVMYSYTKTPIPRTPNPPTIF